MAKDLPYFRWYAADAETDEFYQGLSYEEKGVYHALLNKAWINNGIPVEVTAIAGLLKLSSRVFLKIWAKISIKWERRGDRFYNPRQEEEREKAISKSEKNKRPGNANASREKRERDSTAIQTEREKNANAPQQALARADSDSDSDSCVAFSLEKGPGKNQDSLLADPPPPAVLQISVMPKSSGRFSEAWGKWPRKQNMDAAAMAWESYVTAENEHLVFDCMDRFLRSGDAARGAVPFLGMTINKPGWLADCARDNWQCEWPTPAERGPVARQPSLRDRTLARIAENIANGEPPI